MSVTALGQFASFVHPSLAAAAAVLAGVPVLIHLLNRRRHRRVSWAAMHFLRAAHRRSAKRIRLEQFILMALRVLAVACVVLALARPQGRSSVAAGVARRPMPRVLLVDRSLSMGMTGASGRTRAEDARSAATALLEGFAARDPVSMVTAGPSVETVVAASLDRRRSREALNQLQPTQGGADFAGALQQVLELLADVENYGDQPAVYVISDLSVADWDVSAGASPAGGAPQEVLSLARRVADRARLHFVRVGGGGSSNVAITAFAPQTPLVSRSDPIRLSADIANFTGKPLQGAWLVVTRDGHVVRRVPVPDIAPEATGRVTLSVAPPGSGLTGLEARLTRVSKGVEDALALDNRRLLAIHVPETMRALIVEGRSGRGVVDTDGGYLATALAPRLADGSPPLWRVRRIAAEHLPQEVLRDYHLVVMCNVPRLSPEGWAHLEACVRTGGGLLVTVGDAVDLEDYNAQTTPTSTGLLPARLSALTGGNEKTDRVRFSGSAEVSPFLREFADAPRSSLLQASIERYLVVEPDDAQADVLARYTNGLPALVEARHGAGRVALLTTAADMSWSNLPAKGDYVSLVHKLAARLARNSLMNPNVEVGGVFRRFLSVAESQQPLTLLDPHGQTLPVGIEPDGDGFALRCENLSESGWYAMGAVGAERLFAVNVAAAEADPRVLEEARLRKLLEGSWTYGCFPSGRDAKGRKAAAADLSGLLIHLGLLVLALETWAAMRFGVSR